jgi:hypothetical protein
MFFNLRLTMQANYLTKLLIIAITILSSSTFAIQAKNQPSDSLLTLKERAALIDKVLLDRLQNTLPALMKRTQVKMWILVAREYNEDPIVMTMLPGTAHAARRRTVLVIVDEGDAGVNGYAVSRYGVGEFFKPVWNPEEQSDQWQALADFIEQKNPDNIAINVSETFALADGLTHGEYLGLTNKLSAKQKTKIIASEPLAIAWLETRSAMEMKIYPTIVAIAQQIIAEGFSNKTITPGKTTTEDLMWWYRERIKALKLKTWFHPSVSIQRADGAEKAFVELFTDTEKDGVILPGDLLHVDFGITYLRLNTDTQQHAYVLRKGETAAPEGLRLALKKGNQLQDILTAEFEVGRTGNEILKAARAEAIKQGLTPSIYTHPIGYQGHGAGPTIGMWDNQGPTIGRGDYPLYANTAHSIELNVRVEIPEWNNKEIRIMLEEDAFFDGNKTTYIAPRQLEFHLIKPKH